MKVPAAGVALLLALPGAARAQGSSCTPDDALARAALEVAAADGPVDGDRLVRIAREAGSDAPSFHAIALASGDDAARAAWLDGLRDGAGGTLACGEAQREDRTIVVAAPRLGHLEVLSDDVPLRIRATLLAELLSPVLYVLDAEGETVALEVPASPSDLELDRDLPLPATLQLVATGPHGPRPVAVLEIGGLGPSSPVLGDLDGRARLATLAAPGDASPLRPSHLLDRVASAHAEAVCAAGVVGHELEPGLEPEARLRRAGVSARHVGEVVARGADETAAWAALAGSPSHLFALRDRRFTDAGIGTAVDPEGRACVVVLLAAWPRYVGVPPTAE